MKVVVSYQSKLEDIPIVVSDLLNNLKDRECQQIFNLISLSATQCEESVSKSLATIDELRKLLTKIDERLIDCSSLLAGYIKTDTDLKMGIDPTKEQLSKEEPQNDDKPETETND